MKYPLWYEWMIKHIILKLLMLNVLRLFYQEWGKQIVSFYVTNSGKTWALGKNSKYLLPLKPSLYPQF